MQRSTGNLHKLSGSAPLEQDSKGAGGGGKKEEQGRRWGEREESTYLPGSTHRREQNAKWNEEMLQILAFF